MMNVCGNRNGFTGAQIQHNFFPHTFYTYNILSTWLGINVIPYTLPSITFILKGNRTFWVLTPESKFLHPSQVDK
jgi:hypothetical protein